MSNAGGITAAPGGAPEASGSAKLATGSWMVITVAVIFGLFYAYDVWEAIGNLVGLSLAAQNLDTRLSGYGLTVLIGGILLPLVVYAVAFWLGRRRGIGVRALLLFVGLCLVAALSLDIYALFGLGNLIV